jgi:hypothetical protein
MLSIVRGLWKDCFGPWKSTIIDIATPSSKWISLFNMEILLLFEKNTNP